jgi:hypothetical protein
MRIWRWAMNRYVRSLLLLCLVIWMLPMQSVLAQDPPDVVNTWTITITPNQDGTVIVKYDIEYTAKTKFPDASFYLDAPVLSYTLSNAGGSIASSYNPDGYHMRINFSHIPTPEEHFSMFWEYTASGLANETQDGNVGYEFKTTAMDFAVIENLVIIWKIPDGNESLVTYTSNGASTADGSVVWKFANLDRNATAAVQIAFAKSAFPGFTPEKPIVPSGQTVPQAGGSGGWGLLGVILIILLAIFGLVLLFAFLAWLFDNNTSSDSTTDYTPSYTMGTHTLHDYSDTTRPSSSPSYSRPSSPSYSPPSHTSSPGGSGSFGGRSSSCVHSSCFHSSCACACACAGSGRAGCGPKKNAFGLTPSAISMLLKSGDNR